MIKATNVHYKGYLIKINPYNIYNHKPATYIYFDEDDCDGEEFWGETVEDCKTSIDEKYNN